MRTARGFTYLGVMFVVAILAMTTAMASALWSTVQRRDSERELVFAGRQVQAALERYRQQSRAPAALYPRTLEELLRDDRSITPQRHLRRIPVDPMTGDRQWGLIRLPDGGIVGVHSLSDRTPFPRKLVTADYPSPLGRSYRDWRFVAPSALELLAQAGPRPAAPAAAEGAVASAPAGSRPSLMVPVPQVRAQAEVPTDAITTAGEAAATPVEVAPSESDACSRLQAQDERRCARLADDAALACRDSATARWTACMLGETKPLPRLILRGD